MDVATYPWDQTLRGQLQFWDSISELVRRYQGQGLEISDADVLARDRLAAELETQLRRWIQDLDTNPRLWNLHGADTTEVLRYFHDAVRALTQQDMEDADAAVHSGYGLVLGE